MKEIKSMTVLELKNYCIDLRNKNRKDMEKPYTFIYEMPHICDNCELNKRRMCGLGAEPANWIL